MAWSRAGDYFGRAVLIRDLHDADAHHHMPIQIRKSMGSDSEVSPQNARSHALRGNAALDALRRLTAAGNWIKKL